MKRILREPLFQFLVIGAVVFAGYAAIQDRTDVNAPETIVITPGRIAHLVETFSRTWQRPPTQTEADGLIDAFIKEEIFYREGRKLGLDTNDTVFRRRLQQKMEFLMEPNEAELTPADGELQAYLDANRESFRIPAQVAFEQVYFDPAKRGANAEADTRSALAQLREKGTSADAAELGDRTLLPVGMPRTPIDRIGISFGDAFANKLADAPVGEWVGPVRSTFGLHLIRVGDKTEARDPDLGEVFDAVSREWGTERRRAIAEQRYADLRNRYEIVVETNAEGAAANSTGAAEQ